MNLKRSGSKTVTKIGSQRVAEGSFFRSPSSGRSWGWSPTPRNSAWTRLLFPGCNYTRYFLLVDCPGFRIFWFLSNESPRTDSGCWFLRFLPGRYYTWSLPFLRFTFHHFYAMSSSVPFSVYGIRIFSIFCEGNQEKNNHFGCFVGWNFDGLISFVVTGVIQK